MNYEKTQNIIDQVKTLMDGVYEKTLFGKERKRDFNTALEHLIHQNGSYDLMWKKRQMLIVQ